MSKTQRIAILDFHNGVTDKRHTFLANELTIDAMVREGWAERPITRPRDSRREAYVTTAGLVAAGVDMDAIHAVALVEDSRRRVAAAVQGHPEALEGTLGGPEMILAVLPLAIEQAHGEALAFVAREQHIAQSMSGGHIRKNCPALRVGGCMKCTAPATVRAARGEFVSAYNRVVALPDVSTWAGRQY